MQSPVERIVVDKGRVRAIRVRGQEQEMSAVMSTAPINILAKLVEGSDALSSLARVSYWPIAYPVFHNEYEAEREPRGRDRYGRRQPPGDAQLGSAIEPPGNRPGSWISLDFPAAAMAAASLPRTETSDMENEAHIDFAGAMSYGDYLQLDKLLGAQQPLSDCHDELLFIIIHQATELWMKLTLHELAAARRLVMADDLQSAFKHLARVSRIQSQLIQSWDVLSTMTPSDYSHFRDALGQSSGFQSAQYRLIEFALGNKQAAMIAPHRHRDDTRTQLERALSEPSLYDESIRLLARRGFAIDPEVLERDVREPYHADGSVLAAWTAVYQDPKRYWDLYQLAEELIDLEDWFQQWRFRHVTTVQRIIGRKRGTGGTAGVGYLRQVLDVTFFPELWDVRTEL